MALAPRVAAAPASSRVRTEMIPARRVHGVDAPIRHQEFEAAGGDPHLLDPVMGVERVYLQTALDALRAQYGSVEGYFTDGLRLDAATQAALRRELVEPAA